MAQDGYERSEISGRIIHRVGGGVWGETTAAQDHYLAERAREWLESQFPNCDVSVDEYASGVDTIYGSWPDGQDASEEIRDAISTEMPTAQWFEMMPAAEEA